MRRRFLIFSLTAIAVATVVLGSTRDMHISVTNAKVEQMRKLRGEPKFIDLPGTSAEQERMRFEPLLNSLLDRLIDGVEQYPSRSWVLAQMDAFVDEFHLEDTELRESCLAYIGRIFDILGIPDDGGAFRKYMIFW
jgi:hypothetical protein